jgi:hypothetical protein
MNRGQLNVDDETQVESSLRSAIKLNPSFAPSYDRLAVFYGMRSLRWHLDAIRAACFQLVMSEFLAVTGTFGKFRELIGTTAEGGHGRELRVMGGSKAGA